ncbi:ATP-binding protein [Enteractinococcus helveticum]|uniref:ATP-binding protein n=1 Tax=Enteractinococcus helveticum TaxID=1837282 RepID=UPI0005BD0E03|nr:DUF4143 domain-containing protein [Enteractinococcus helveticum]
MPWYNARFADETLKRSLQNFGAVIVQGPRAVGKTTTAKQAAASSIRLDSSPDLPAFAETSPSTIMQGDTPRLIDEWQLAPTIWNAVRHEVDERSGKGHFILTGSATPADDITRHSGAGRFRRILMRPMSLAESNESTRAVSLQTIIEKQPFSAFGGGPTVESYAHIIVRGGWPALVTDPTAEASEYLDSYLDDMTRVDLAATDQRVDPARMNALVRALARNVSSEVTLQKLAAEADVIAPGQGPQDRGTIRRYLDALERIFVVEEQPAWSTHLRSKVRMRVQPKWHFIDPSLAAAALQASPTRLVQDLNTFGFLFESLAIRDLRIYAELHRGNVYHYRDETGLEVDAIIEFRDGRWIGFEVKMGGTEHINKAATSLLKLKNKLTEERAAQNLALVVLTAGEISHTRNDGVSVISLGHLTA